VEVVEVEVEEVEVEEYPHHHQEVEEEAEEAEEVEVEEALQEDHHPPMEDSKGIPPSSSQEIEKEAKHSC